MNVSLGIANNVVRDVRVPKALPTIAAPRRATVAKEANAAANDVNATTVSAVSGAITIVPLDPLRSPRNKRRPSPFLKRRRRANSSFKVLTN